MSLNIYFNKSILIALSITSVLIGSNIIGEMSILFAQTNDAVNCIRYDSVQKLIYVSCKSIHLNDIYRNIKNTSILAMEISTVGNTTSKGKVWILNAGITIEKAGELVIDSTDTSWLKLVPTTTIQKNGQTGYQLMKMMMILTMTIRTWMLFLIQFSIPKEMLVTIPTPRSKNRLL